MAARLLHTDQLAIGYTQNGQTHCLAAGINLRIQPGQLIALVGQNGVGKSSLLRSLCHLQPPLSGAVYVNDKNIKEFTPQTWAQAVSVVLTEKLPPSNLSVWELVALGRQPYTNWIGTLTEPDEQAIAQAIHDTQLTAIQHQKWYSLSDGQLQKALIARALAQETPLIILDEPTTHLDLVHKLKLLKLLKSVSQTKKKSVLFSTHDIELALSICDELIVMTPTKVVQDRSENLLTSGIFSELFADPSIAFDPALKKFNFTL